MATLDPRYATQSFDIKVTRLIHAGLFGLDPNTLEPVPLVARRFEYRDESTLEVELKDGIRFHSGRPLSAEDVCATLRALADPALHSPHRAVVESIGGCDVKNPLELWIHLRAPRATLLTDLEVPILSKAQVDAVPDPSGKLDGLGPFSVERSTPTEVHLKPANTGVVPAPAHAVVVRTVHDANARVLRLLAGRSDIAPNSVSPALLPPLVAAGEVTVASRAGASVTYLLLHNERPPFDHAETRRAIAFAIDRDLIARTLFAGHASVAAWLLPPGHWALRDRFEPLPFAPERARISLSGLEPVTLLTSADRARVTVARAVAQMLGDAGLEVRVVPLDLGALLERLDHGDYSMAILQIPELTEPNILKWFFHPDAVPGEGGIGRNRARYRNREAARLLDRAASEKDREIRGVLYTQLGRLMLEDMPVVSLWHEDQVAVLSSRARDFTLSAEGRWLSVARLP
jgi:peptide/nickel transport system substrate-binding protein